MGIPASTTTVTVLRPDATADTYDDDSGPTELETVRAHISSPRGSGSELGGQLSVQTPRLQCDPTDLRHTDFVRDNNTNLVYSLTWVSHRQGLGIDHIEAGLQLGEGAN